MCVCVCVCEWMKKSEKQNIPNVMHLFMRVKAILERFGFIKPSSGLYDGEKLLLEQGWILIKSIHCYSSETFSLS